MAKRRSSRGRRDPPQIANQRLTVLTPLVSPSNPYSLLSEIEDRRNWHPDGEVRPAASFSTPNHRLQYPEPKKTPRNRDKFGQLRQARVRALPLSSNVQFSDSRNVLICVRRKQRKEVMHALKKVGRGKGGRKKPRRNYYSNVRC